MSSDGFVLVDPKESDPLLIDPPSASGDDSVPSPYKKPGKWTLVTYLRLCAYALSGLLVSSHLFVTLILALPLWLASPRWYRSVARWAVAALTSWAVLVMATMSPHFQIVLTGDWQSIGERAVLFSNHQTLLDWWFLALAAWYTNNIFGVKIILMDVLRKVPFFGWIAYLVGHIFFQRKIAVDQSRLAEALMHMPTSQESKTPLWLVIFPEGLLVHQRNLTKAKEFLDKLRRETPPPKFIVRQPSHVILPRSKGMWNVLQLLNPRHADSPIDTLVDVTMGFWPSSRGYESGLYPEHAHNPLGVFAHGGQEVLSAVHVDFRILNKGLVRTLTQLDENDFHVWLNKYWEGKDDLMGHFHRKGTFVGFKRDENIVRNSLPKEVRGDFMDTGYGGTSDSGFVVTDTGKAIFHVFPRFGDVLNLGILMAVPWTFVFGLIQLGKLVSNQL